MPPPPPPYHPHPHLHPGCGTATKSNASAGGADAETIQVCVVLEHSPAVSYRRPSRGGKVVAAKLVSIIYILYNSSSR